MRAWSAVQSGDVSPLADLMSADNRIIEFVEPSEVRELLQADGHIGDVPERALWIVAQIREDVVGEKDDSQ